MGIPIALRETVLTGAFMKGQMALQPDGAYNALVREYGAEGADVTRFPIYTSLPLPVAGGSLKYARIEADYMDLTGEEWPNGLEIPDKALIADHKLNVILKKAQGLAQTYRNAYIVRALTMLGEGDATTYGTAIDGQAFFSATHGWGGAGSILNLIAVGQVSTLNVVTPAAPTKTEVETFWYDLMAYIQKNTVDDQGNYMFLGQEEATVICPTGMKGGFLGAFDASLVAPGSTSTLLKGKARVFDSPVLSGIDTDKFYLILKNPGDDEMPLLRVWWPQLGGSEYDLRVTGPDSDTAQLRKQRFSTNATTKFGYGAWWNCFRIVLS